MKRDSTVYGAVRPAYDKSDCTVRALSVAAGCAYHQASAIYSAAGRQMKKGAYVETSERVHEQWLKMKRIRDYDGWPLAAFIAANLKGRFIVHKKNHAFAVVEGILHDWETTTKARSEVLRVWEVTEETLSRIEKTAKLFE